MKSIKDTSTAFIVRIWIEHREIRNAEPVWRGVIENVEDGERVYFDHLEKLCSYFAEYLKHAGIDLNNLK